MRTIRWLSLIGLMALLLGAGWAQTLSLVLPNGDANGDNRVDDADLLAVLAGFGTPAADLDGNGTTDDANLLLVLSNFGAEGASLLQGTTEYAYDGYFFVDINVTLQSANPSRYHHVVVLAQPVDDQSVVYETESLIVGASGSVRVWLPDAELYRIQAFVPNGTWLRAETTHPVGLQVRNLRAIPGNRCVALTWSELPENSVLGYRVYRRTTGSGWSIIATLPSSAYMFGDTNLVNGQAYEYEVEVFGHSGVLHRSPTVRATPAADVPQLVWDSSHHTEEDTMVLRLRYSDGSARGLQGHAMIVVDGSPYAGVGVDSSDTRRLTGVIDMSELSVGTHQVQVIMVGEKAFVSESIPLATASPINEVRIPDVSYIGTAVPIHAQISGAVQDWSVRVTNIDDQVVVSWTGTGNLIDLVWDGTPAEDGIYVVEISARLQGGREVRTRRTTTRIARHDSPNALALVQKLRFPAQDVAFAKHLAFHWRRIKQRAQGIGLRFDYHVFVTTKIRDRRFVPKLLRWLRSTCEYLYIYGHGGSELGPPPNAVIHWGGISFWASQSSYTDRDPAPYIVGITELIGTREYKYFFADGCNTAGDAGGPLNLSLQQAFNSEVFVGWYGPCGMNTPPREIERDWRPWRDWYWDHLGTGWRIWQAYNFACNSIWPFRGMPINAATNGFVHPCVPGAWNGRPGPDTRLVQIGPDVRLPW